MEQVSSRKVHLPDPAPRSADFEWLQWDAAGWLVLVFLLILAGVYANAQTGGSERFTGRFFSGVGDVEYLRLLDTSRRMFAPDPEFQNVSMLYMPSWNGLVEGPTWDAWWIQNSYGTTYCALPFYQEPFVTFLQNSQDLWFDQMGDGKRVGAPAPFNWTAPDGCLCDAARPGWIVYKQGDGRVAIHDWGMEFTAAGVLMQAELLLISRDREAIGRYLPKLERCVEFIESRRDQTNNLFLAGPAGNLLAPSYAGWHRPDGTYGQSCLAGLSVTYIAALDRLIQLEWLVGNAEQAQRFTARRESAAQALPRLMTDEGYFIRSLDPDGTRHGVFAAAQHGYFESSPNHDAICFRVVGDAAAEKIYAKLASIPGLRPNRLVIPNYPSYDDMYEKPEGLWTFGTWVNGGHWSTCEARMIMAYYRLGRYEDARASMAQLLTFARAFRMDNPLVKFGAAVYQPNEPINLTYDAFGPPAAMIRGLFEYLYSADGLTLIPHIPPGITEFQQLFPIRFGRKQLFLAAAGRGPITRVMVNGSESRQALLKTTNGRGEFSSNPRYTPEGERVFFAYDALPDRAEIWLLRGPAAQISKQPVAPSPGPMEGVERPAEPNASWPELAKRCRPIAQFHERLVQEGLGLSYEAAHAQLISDAFTAARQRRSMLAQHQLALLPEPSQTAAEKLYLQTVNRLCDGLEKVLQTYSASTDPHKKRIVELNRSQ